MKLTTRDALFAKKRLTPEQLDEIEKEWVFGSAIVIAGLLAHIRILMAEAGEKRP